MTAKLCEIKSSDSNQRTWKLNKTEKQQKKNQVNLKLEIDVTVNKKNLLSTIFFF